MVGPVLNFAPTVSSRYQIPDYSPIARGMTELGRNLGQGLIGLRDRRQDATLAELFAGAADHRDLVDRASAAGVPMSKIAQALTIRKALAPPVRSPYTLAPGAARFGPGGEEIARNPAAPKGDKGFTLGAGQVRYDAAGKVVARGPDKPNADRPPIQNVISLSNAWQKATGPLRAIMRQRDLMQIGLERAAAGDMAAGSQAVLVTFQKILDPTSVVRESEYARSASGLSLIEQTKGAFEKLKEGGAGMTLEQLGSFARFADEAVAKLTEGRIGKERARIKRFADAYGIDPSLIFEGRLGAPPPPAADDDARTDAVMQAFGLGGPGFDPQTRPPPAQASAMPVPFMGDAGLVSGGLDFGRMSDADLAGLNPTTPQERAAMLAEINRRLASAGARP